MAIFLRYIASMFEVLAFVYENYFAGETCPEPAHLERKLNAVGFESEEIDDALKWLQGLDLAARASQPDPWLVQPSPDSLRIYPDFEQNHLGAPALGFIRFLESAGVLPPHMREVVIDRAMAAPGGPISLDDLKIIVLMVYWGFGQEPDTLVLDELCDDPQERIAH
jgi:Smg protein